MFYLSFKLLSSILPIAAIKVTRQIPHIKHMFENENLKQNLTDFPDSTKLTCVAIF